MGALLVRDEGPVRILSIDRPERRNALSLEVVEAVTAALQDLPAETRAVVLTGEGAHFSAGGDAASVADAVEGGTTDQMMVSFHATIRALRDCERPVVAAIFGSVYGGAFNLALACDVVVAAADVQLCQVFLRLGVVPDLGAAYLLARAVGTQRAMELVLSARVVEADEALALGIVSRVSPTRDAAVAAAVALASTVAGYSPTAVTETVRLMRGARDQDFDTALDVEAEVQARLLTSPEARAAFGSIRKPRA